MLLTINSGSSSIKFAVYQTRPLLGKIISGQINRIGLPGTVMVYQKGGLTRTQTNCGHIEGNAAAINYLISWLEAEITITDLKAIGHRVVHGMAHTRPALVTAKLLKDLQDNIPYDPDHLPAEIKLIEAFQQHYPDTPQFVCFDTAFHNDMPLVAKLLPIPQRFRDKGIHRYGFHGLSCQFLMQQLENLVGKKAAMGRVILAHLGSGASITAVLNGKSIDTSMGFTPAGGLPMSTRAGDLDPGVAWVMMKQDDLNPKQFSQLINHECGLLGVSGTSADMSDLLASEAKDANAANAVNLFCYQAKKYIGAYAAVLGGVDFLVFSGGIGEHSPVIRARICEGLAFLDIELDEVRNNENASFISANESRVSVRVIPTNEELIIAETVNNMLDRLNK